VDLAAAVSAAADALGVADPAARSAAVAASMNALDNGLVQVASARADQGIRADRLDKIRDALAVSGLQLEEQKAGIEGADIPEVIARIQSRQLNLQAAQAIFAQVNRSSLFDLLR
jgi:flagellar hook-associated protein 3 FlgL